MTDTLKQEFHPGQVITGMEQQPDVTVGSPLVAIGGLNQYNPVGNEYWNNANNGVAPSPLTTSYGTVPSTVPQPPKPITRPTFLSAFLQNLGPALAAGAGESSFGGGLGKGLQGIEENKRYKQQQDVQSQQLQRQLGIDRLSAQNIGSQMQRRDVQNVKDLTAQPTVPHNTVTLDNGVFQYNPETQAYDIPVGQPKATAARAPTDREAWLAENPGKTSGDYFNYRASLSRTGSAASDNRLDRSYQYNSTQIATLRKPLDDQLDRLGRLVETVNQATPQADSLIAPELMTVMAGGQGSGVRITEPEISRIIGGRSNYESLKAALNKWSLDPSKALSVTPVQRGQIRQLIEAVQGKAQAKQAAFDDAQEALIDATTPEQHQRALLALHKKLTQIDNGKAGNEAVTPQPTHRFNPATGKIEEIQ